MNSPSQEPIRTQIHERILARCEVLSDWLKTQAKSLFVPIYSSYDIRDSGDKIVNVDANIFPAGFNNICPVDKDTAGAKVQRYLNTHYGSAIRKILILAEEHTNNLYYWENIFTLQNLIQSAGYETRIAMPRQFDQPLRIETHEKHEVQVWPATRVAGGVAIGDFAPDLIVSNNDFSEPYIDWSEGLTTPMNPPRELGWYQRKKDRYFTHYNRLAGEFAEHLGLDPWHFQLETRRFDHFDVAEDESSKNLADFVDQMISDLHKRYQALGIDRKPYVFVKNNSGTYGLAVVQVNSGDDVRHWNYKTRKKMKAAKGGRDVHEVIVQEGIHSVVKSDSQTAEPVIYMIGTDLAGGFLRTHGEKGPTESLNSPGAVYRRMCVSDLVLNQRGCPMENVYGWSAILGALAIGLEAQDLQVPLPDFKFDS